MNKNLDFGTFVISLDFELMWGMKDIATPDGYGQSHVANVPVVIDRLISLFEKYNVNATVAAVGLIFAKDPSEVSNFEPKDLPSYVNGDLSPYTDNYIQNIAHEHFNLYFAPDIINRLKECPNIEVGTHTFCHYYCNEAGQNATQFRQNLESAKKIAKNFDIDLQSIIFPRNEVNAEYLNICRELGVTTYRGNALKYFNSSSRLGNLRNRICRLIDTYLPINNSTTYDYDTLKEDGMVDIRASRFLSPYSSLLSPFRRLQLSRISKEMTIAAQKHQLYHLWWHPHNFGADTDKNFIFLEEILRHYTSCKNEYGMHSLSMTQLSNLL